MKLRWHLMAFAIVIVVPVLLFVGILAWWIAGQQREVTERGIRDTTRALSLAADREVGRAEALLTTLAVSPDIDASDFASFYRQAAAVSPANAWITLIRPNGEQVINTLRPFGARLPRAAGMDVIRSVVESRRTVISDVFVGALAKRPIVTVDLPVIRNGVVVYSIDMSFGTERLRDLLLEGRLPAHWVAGIFDRRGVVIARTRNHERTVGQPGAPEVVATMARSAAGWSRTLTLEGDHVYWAWETSRASGWRVAVGVPEAVVNAPVHRVLWIIGGAGAVFAIVVAASAFVFGRRIAAPIGALAEAADALGRGEEIRGAPASPVREVDEVRRALESASRGLRARAAEQERLLAEQAARGIAEAANRAKDEFLATLSHELRTPLTTMLGWIRVLRVGQLDPLKQERALETIERNTLTQARMIDELLDMSRIVAGKMSLDRRPTGLGPVVAETVDSFRQQVEAKKLTLEVRLDPTAGNVFADPHRIRQVLANLLTNAMKYTPTGGRVEVQLTGGANVVRLCVRDTGIGIEPALLPSVFERFRQADWRTAGTQGGLGLGLAIVREIVELHGGTAEAESDGPGRGAAFIVMLPVTRDR